MRRLDQPLAPLRRGAPFEPSGLFASFGYERAARSRTGRARRSNRKAPRYRVSRSAHHIEWAEPSVSFGRDGTVFDAMEVAAAASRTGGTGHDDTAVIPRD